MLPNYRQGCSKNFYFNFYFIFFYVFFFWMDLTKSHLILKNQYVRKLILLRYICGNEYSPIRIILKLTFLFQLFSKFRKNVVWPVKAKPKISAKIFVRQTLKVLCIETENSAYFWRLHNRFRKSNYLIKEIFVEQKFPRKKILVT